jgi:SSS family transporter
MIDLCPPILGLIIPRRLSQLDYLVIALYFSVNLGIGWWCSRRKQATSKDFFLGGGRMAWWATAVSYFATTTSSISYMALPAATFAGDWTVFGSSPAQSFAGIVIGFAFVRLLRQLNLTTVFGYIDQRFDRRVRLLGAGLAVLLKIGGRMSIIMLLPAIALSTVTGLNVYASILLMGLVTTFYALEGGFEAVIWTDVLQATVMVGGMLLAIGHLAANVDGGMAGLLRVGEAEGKFRTVIWDLSLSRPTVWVFVGMFYASLFNYVADQPLMQRVFAAPNVRAARNTVVLGNSIAVTASLLFFFLGTALFVFYHSHPERLAPSLANDAIFPYFIANELPHGIVGLIVAGLFAASMGALSSTINAMAAIVVSDFQGTFFPRATPAAQVRLARASTLVAGTTATAMACYLASLGLPSLWEQFLRLVALIGGGFPGVFALGLLTKRATSAGVMIGAVASIGVTGWVQSCTSTSPFFHGFVAISSCMVIGYLASLFIGRRKDPATLRGLVIWDLPAAKAEAVK